jgi:hypothetical protein
MTYDAGSDRVLFLGDLSPNQAEAMRRLGEIVNLPPNWDSYGSPPPTTTAVEIVMDLLETIDNPNLPAPRVVPVSGGGLQLEWNVSPRELQLEISGEGIAQCLQIEDRRPVREEEITYLTTDRIRSLLTWLVPWAAERRAAA